MDATLTNKAHKETDGPMKRFITKFSTGQFPVGKHMERLKIWDTNLCPCCLKQIECKQHLLRCEDIEVSTKRASYQIWLQEQLKIIKTHPKSIQTLLFIVKTISNDETAEYVPDNTGYNLLQDQGTIGYMELLIGRWSKQ